MIRFVFSAITFLGLLFGHSTFAQERVAVCKDSALHQKLVMHSKTAEQKGLSVFYFSSMEIPSGSIVPVQLKLEKGVRYHIYFQVSADVQKYSLTLMNPARKKVVNVKSSDKEGWIDTEYVPDVSGNYVLMLTQKVKNSAYACGGICITKVK